MRQIKILDCTLRDGGYYNNWQFSVQKANKYLKKIYSAGIDVVEVGFNFFKHNSNYGHFAFVDNKFIKKKLLKSKKTKLAIMINAADFDTIKINYKKYLNKKFKSKKPLFSIIRVACHYKDLEKTIKYLKYLKSLGYEICLNLMQINNVKKKELINCLNLIEKKKCVDIFYFADSFGNLKPQDIKKICNIISKNWNKEFGIHSHDNCGLALKNCIQAYRSGATWIDGTVQGMGRGAGNVTTENLLSYFSSFKYKQEPIKSISKSYFLRLKKRYKWGKSNYYKIAAKHNIHPTYIQELQKDNRYTKSEILNSINNLKTINAKSFDPKKIENMFFENKLFHGEWNANKWCAGRAILLLGQGNSLKNKKSLKNIKNYILKKKCLVMSVNINNYVPSELIDIYVSVNENRIIVDNLLYESLNKPIIIPKNKLREFTKISKKLKLLDYGVKYHENKFEAKHRYAIIPHNQSFAYAIGVLIAGHAKSIMLAGFDGFDKKHLNQIEMEKIIYLIKKNNPYLNLQSITKNSYSIKTSS